MQEDLLGYLLGALSEQEMHRISALLGQSPELRADLEVLKKTIDAMEGSYAPVDPPASDLVAKTLDWIDEHKPEDEMLPSVSISGSEEDIISETNGRILEGSHRSHVKLSESPLGSSGALGGRWFDWVAAASVAMIILCVILPALANGRFEARKVACQDQLRLFGVAITQFVTRTPEQRLPAVAESGPEAFAGVYAIRLNESGLLPEDDVRWCPSLPVPDFGDSSLVNLGEIESIDTLHQVSINDLKEIQRFAGGHYAYNLGVLEEDHYASPRFESRASFAIMSDTPLVGNLAVNDLERGDRLSEKIGHSGRGINVLFEDGRVKFIPVESIQAMPDHPLLNHLGEVEAGVNIDDATLAPSWRAPFRDVSQR
ncbi:hypothetical protein N9M41_03340 [Rhodopirellula sp.]|nr:hypothetical protein [Rhodopirellula sp.]